MSRRPQNLAAVWHEVINYLTQNGILVKRGNKYFCPFCENPNTSRSPSFAIDLERGLATCFGSCGRKFRGPDGPFRLLMELGQPIPPTLQDYARDLQDDLAPLVWYLNNLIWEDKRVQARLQVRGIDIFKHEDLIVQWPIGVFDPRVPDEVLTSEKVRELWNRVKAQIDGFATVHGYIDPVTNKVIGIKVIPFDPRSYKTLKDKIRFFALDNNIIARSYHGIPHVFDEYERIYIVEGEFDALATAANEGYPAVIALGGQTSKGEFPDKVKVGKKFIILPDQFGEKKGEQLLLTYAKNFPTARVLNWYMVPDKYKVYEDPNDLARGKVSLSELESYFTSVAEFVKDYIARHVDLNERGQVLDFIRQHLLQKLSPQLYLELTQLPELSYLPTDLVREIVRRKPVGIEEIELAERTLRQYFKPVYVEVEENPVLYVKVTSTGTIVPVALHGEWSKTFARLGVEVGENYKEFFLSIMPFPQKEDETLNKYWNRIKQLIVDAFQSMAAKFKGRLKPEHKILEPGVHYIPEEGKLVVVDRDRTYIVSKTGIEKTSDPILFDGRYVVRPLHGSTQQWLPLDIPWKDYAKIDPVEVYNELKDYFKALIDLTETPFEFQYDLLPLLALYGNAFDAFENIVLFSFHGNSGSGKSTLLAALTGGSRHFPKLIIPSKFLTNYTAAGIRQLLGSSRLFLGLDEAEPEQLQEVMDEIRSLTGTEGTVVRGTREQKVVATELRFAAATSMIYLPTRTQDVNRLLVFKTVRKTGLMSPALRLKQLGWDYEKIKQLSYRTFLAALKLAAMKDQTSKERAEEYILSIRRDTPPREVELQSTLAEIAVLLGIENNIRESFARFLHENLSLKEQPTQEEVLLNSLLTYSLQMERFGKMALAEVAYRVWKGDAELENITIQRGWYRHGNWLYVPLSEVDRLFDKVGYSNFAAYLKASEIVDLESAYLKLNLLKLAEKIESQRGTDLQFNDAKL
jgi:energy-coupling factor transporter ATP-binding protein EcfA2